ncbi:MAG: xanthine dehydrogenase family protein molybdopterin-binding subunit [Pigmentiphaga sp.]|uniref:xanthine dehydrogenase family protein molybdopterin-binding subunit n=1 Tax=Pigmentiphaga sp. TaxID=1977564 RepID=UPI0029AAE001|nr:xanthine dehydrogenase family protein molybdopterin-binding subunit [Pigmentiphaga sp.]MDX3906380.1 xanthine dehydrogenase family protein molybdopterin-binding subunit [Pigmentiphaga sp.]
MTPSQDPPRAPGGTARIGDAIPRLEDDRLLRGEACFLDDVGDLPGILHACFVRSPHPHARIARIDTSAAQTLPGIVAVLTAKDLEEQVRPILADMALPGFVQTTRDVLVSDRARFVGDGIALCVGEDPYQVLDAAELVDVQFDPLPAVAWLEDALAEDAPRVHDNVPGNQVFRGSFATPGFDAEQEAAPLRLREEFRSGRIACVSMEPRGCIAHYDPDAGRLRFWSSTQVPHILRTCLAEQLGLDESAITVIVPDVGGGFGGKTTVYPDEIAVAAAAMRLGRPVKWVQDRYDDLLTTSQARDHRYLVDAGFDHEGRLLTLDVDVAVNVGAYPMLPFGSSLEANGAPRNMPGPYRLRHFRYATQAVLSNTCGTGAYRGVAAPLACFVMESVMDRIAARLKLDPAEVRRRNLVTEFPYVNVLGLTYEEGCFLPALDRALELIDYRGFRAEQTAQAPESRVRKGIGLAVITEQTGMGRARYQARGLLRIPGHEAARVTVQADGMVEVFVSQASQGQGHQTAFAQIAADTLGIPIDRISVVEGDTARTPGGTGTFASRGMVLAGGAVEKAAQAVKRRMAAAAAEGQPAGGFSEEAQHDIPGIRLASGVHAVTVQVDLDTGKVAIDDYVVIHDCGRMINPMMVDGQIHGAVVQGIGEVLQEQVSYARDGTPLSVSLLDYHLPRASTLRKLVVEAMHTEAGAKTFKGVGESGTIGAVPALANAIADALADLGIRPTRLPLDPATLAGLIGQVEAAQAPETQHA